MGDILIILGILIPLIGTSLGSLIALFFNIKPNSKLYNFMLGSASGVMMAASIWSLILPSLDISGNNVLPTLIGFILGIGFLLIFDMSQLSKNTNMLNFSVVIHNIPEGFCVGIGFASALSGNEVMISAAFLLSLGIGIQNIPEGAIISINMLSKKSKLKSVMYGFLSGIVEPIASVISILLVYLINPILPYSLSFAAGAMVYVVVDDLIPSSSSKIGVIGFGVGFLIMMILDVVMS